MARIRKANSASKTSNSPTDDSEIEFMRLQLKEKEDELSRANMLLNKLDVMNVVRPLSDEEEIASIQLEKIKNISRERALTLEEVKIYDLLVKNKRLAQGEVTDINGNKNLNSMAKKDLIKIAAKKK